MAKAVIPPDLIPRVANRDEKAFEELYRLTYKPLFSFLLSLTTDQESAKDLMQETYLSVFVSASKYREQGNPLAWIMKIGKNLFLMEKRSKESRVILLEDAGEENREISFNSIEDIETRELLQMLFAILSREERNIVTLHDVAGLKHREIADILDLPVGTVLSKYYRAIRKMKEKARTEGWQGI